VSPQRTLIGKFPCTLIEIFRDPKLCDWKLKQSAHFLLEIEKFLQEKAKHKTETPLIITGDFNSMPSSGMYELYAKGQVSSDHKDFFGGKSIHSANLKNPFELESVYSHVGEPVTNITPNFSGALDYIWTSRKGVGQAGLLEILPGKDLSESGFLPSKDWPSDHVSLVAELYIK
jgi:CCR4-NOT transcription complex subunit 6